MIDLHTHTVRSDGHRTPLETTALAEESGLSVFAITDHNVLLPDADFSALQALRPSLRLINGSEISCVYGSERGDIEVHIVALGFDSARLVRSVIASIKRDREGYINEILRLMRVNCGIEMPSYEEIRRRFSQTEHLGRMSLAVYLMEEHITKSIDEGFDRYFGTYGERRAYVPALDYSVYPTVPACVRGIVEAGGVPVLAHPFSYALSEDGVCGLIRDFRGCAPDAPLGIEVFYRKYSDEKRQKLMRFAERFGLLASSASDYHYSDPGDTLMDPRHLCGFDLSRHVVSRLVDEETLSLLQKRAWA